MLTGPSIIEQASSRNATPPYDAELITDRSNEKSPSNEYGAEAEYLVGKVDALMGSAEDKGVLKEGIMEFERVILGKDIQLEELQQRYERIITGLNRAGRFGLSILGVAGALYLGGRNYKPETPPIKPTTEEVGVGNKGSIQELPISPASPETQVDLDRLPMGGEGNKYKVQSVPYGRIVDSLRPLNRNAEQLKFVIYKDTEGYKHFEFINPQKTTLPSDYKILYQQDLPGWEEGFYYKAEMGMAIFLDPTTGEKKYSEKTFYITQNSIQKDREGEATIAASKGILRNIRGEPVLAEDKEKDAVTTIAEQPESKNEETMQVSYTEVINSENDQYVVIHQTSNEVPKHVIIPINGEADPNLQILEKVLIPSAKGLNGNFVLYRGTNPSGEEIYSIAFVPTETQDGKTVFSANKGYVFKQPFIPGVGEIENIKLGDGYENVESFEEIKARQEAVNEIIARHPGLDLFTAVNRSEMRTPEGYKLSVYLVPTNDPDVKIKLEIITDSQGNASSKVSYIKYLKFTTPSGEEKLIEVEAGEQDVDVTDPRG